MKHLWAWGLGAAGVAFVFWPRSASAAGPGGRPPGPCPTPGRWPNTPFRATVIVPRSAALPNGGIRVHHEPKQASPETLNGNPATFTDRTMTVLQTGVCAADGTAGEWFYVQPDSGPPGYARAIDPAGVANFEVAPQVSAGVGFGAEFSPVSNAWMSATERPLTRADSPVGTIPNEAFGIFNPSQRLSPLLRRPYWWRRRATVNANVGGGMRVRAEPNLNAQILTVAENGSTVMIDQTGLAPTDGSGGEWWRISLPLPGSSQWVTGYSRAVDPQGIRNFLPA